MAPVLSLRHWVLSHLIGLGVLMLAAVQFQSVVGLPPRLTMLDIGQGDALLIQTPEYHNILIDAGVGGLVVDRLSEKLGFFDKTIDLFILTHPHNDHYGGIMDVLQKYTVKKIMLTGVPNGDPLYHAFLDEAKARQIPIIFPEAGHDLQIGPDLALDFIYPLPGQSLIGQDVGNKNNSSIVTRLVRRTADGLQPLAILEGDAEQEEEREILLSGADVRAEVLKVGHHGSRTSTSPPYLSAVQPIKAVISAGAGNTFGHPHPETLEKLKNIEVKVTMTDGSIETRF